MIPDFPFEPYREQATLYDFLVSELDHDGKTLSMLQLNTGGGKTLLSLAAVKNRPQQVVYATKTFVEMKNVLRQARMFSSPPESGMILASKSKVCAIPAIRDSKDCEEQCERMISQGTCPFYARLSQTEELPLGLLDIEDLATAGVCPYFAARKFAMRQKLLISAYNYLLDDQIKVLDFLDSDSIIIFDEAHNLRAASCDCYTVAFAKNELELCKSELAEAVVRLKTSGVGSHDVRMQFFYQLSFMLEELFRLREATEQTIFNLENEIQRIFAAHRYTVELLKDPYQVMVGVREAIGGVGPQFDKIARFAYLLALILDNPLHLQRKFALTIDFPYMNFENAPGYVLAAYRSVLQLSCLDPSIALGKILKTFRKIVLMSGTLAPFDFTLKQLNISSLCSENQVRINTHLAHKKKNYKLFWCKTGLNKADIFLDFRRRTDPEMIDTTVSLLNSICKQTGDGILLFFPSFAFMEQFVAFVRQGGKSVGAGRLIFFETASYALSDHAMNCHRLACETGRGSIFCAIARGRYAEGLDIGSIYGRICMILGVPFVRKSAQVLCSIEFCKSIDISEEDFVLMDACRISQQAIGRICRQEDDYGCIVFIESRYRQIIRLLDDQARAQGFYQSDGDAVCQGIRDFLLEQAIQRQ